MMKPTIFFKIIALTLGFSSFCQMGFSRDWTDIQNRTISAVYVSQTETEVTLRMTGNNKEVTIAKTRLSKPDLEHLKVMAANKVARFFHVNTSDKSQSPWFYVVEADTLFRPPEGQAGDWVKDTGRSGEKPPPVDLPVLVEKGVQRFVNPQSRQTLVVFGAEEYDLLEKVTKLELFDKLRIREKRSLMAVLSANQLEHGKAARAAVSALLADGAVDSFNSLKTADQSEMFLKKVEESSPNLDRNFEMTSFQEIETDDRWRKESRYTAFQIEEAETAWKNEVRVKGVGKVEVYSLREDDKDGLEAIAKGLSCLPPEMIEYLQKVSLHYKGEGFWWGGGSQIYYVAKRDLKFNGPLVYVMAHEVGHCIQAQKVRGGWNEALENCIVFPSAYGLTNVAEDFAEFAAIVTRSWTKPQEMIEIEEVFPWRHEIYTKALGYGRASSSRTTDKAVEQ